MRTKRILRGAATVRSVVLAMLLVAVSGCSDVLAVAGLTRLDGYWSGSYDSGIDFYLELSDDLYGLYGRAGLTRSGETSSGGSWIDGRREGSHVTFYYDDGSSADGLPLFEGEVTGSDRIDGLLYLDVIPKHVVLHRR
ncbi:MAG TPA: hypothetical protein VFJ82_00505 [Longimicrobium sp.]|nr:hypothetical protein [Longimicrobium sp.]